MEAYVDGDKYTITDLHIPWPVTGQFVAGQFVADN